jgi:hypothetical protein
LGCSSPASVLPAEQLHGAFHLVARRIEGRWRIVVDSDEGDTVTAEMYAEAAAIDDIAPFCGSPA